jgi:hypothetical protein
LYLRERVRAREVPTERVALAAALGHPAAGLAARAPTLMDWQQLVKAISKCGTEALVRAQIAVARRVIERFATAVDRPPETNLYTAGAAVLAAESWLLCPCPACAEAALVAADQSIVGPIRFNRLSVARNAALMVQASTLREARRCATIGLDDRDVVAVALVPWLLGIRDPVAARRRG